MALPVASEHGCAHNSSSGRVAWPQRPQQLLQVRLLQETHSKVCHVFVALCIWQVDGLLPQLPLLLGLLLLLLLLGVQVMCVVSELEDVLR
jgi:hypothetical protein